MATNGYQWLAHRQQCVIATALIILSGCANFAPPPESLQQAVADWEAASSPFTSAHSSQPIVVLGDNQEHFNLGLPHGLLSLYTDTLVAVTVRPSQHSLFGRQTFREILASTDGLPLIHLGDFLDHSCYTEYDDMFAVFEELQNNRMRPWAIAPGNHDGLFNGIVNLPNIKHESLLGSYGWRLLCRKMESFKSSKGRDIEDECWEGVLRLQGLTKQFVTSLEGAPLRLKLENLNFNKYHCLKKIRQLQGMFEAGEEWDLLPVTNEDVDLSRTNVSKDELLRRYIRLVTGKSLPEPNYAKPKIKVDVSSAPGIGANASFVEGVEGVIFDRQPACLDIPDCPVFTSSYLLQTIRLPQATGSVPFKVILLDTTNTAQVYDRYSALKRTSPGDVGYMDWPQLKALAKIVDGNNDAFLIFAGHHNWESLDQQVRNRLREQFCKLSYPVVYLSAHHHNGFWAKHQVVCAGDVTKDLTELNVSSLADWPVSYRTLQFEASADLAQLRINSPALPGASLNVGSNSEDELNENWENAVCEDLTVAMRDKNEKAVSRLNSRGVGIWNFLTYPFRTLDGKAKLLYFSSISIHIASLRTLALLSESPDFNDHFVWLAPELLPEDCRNKDENSAALNCYADNLEEFLSKSTPPRTETYDTNDRAIALIASFRQQLSKKERSGDISERSRKLMSCLHVLAAKADYIGDGGKLTESVNNCQFINSVTVTNSAGIPDSVSRLCHPQPHRIR